MQAAAGRGGRFANSALLPASAASYALTPTLTELIAQSWQNAANSAEKGPVVGRNISHAHNVTPRRFEPNLQRVRALVNGGIQRLRVCTRCLRSGKVVKAA